MLKVSPYLRRIGYTGSTEPTRATLDALIACHLATVPFENIDIVRLNRPIVLDAKRHYAKIVDEQRGGFCFELNGLFGELLETMGYRVTRGYGVWPSDEGRWTEPFEHIVLTAELPATGERMLVDVGFGADCPVVSIPLGANDPVTVDHHTIEAYRAVPIPEKKEHWRIEAKRRTDDWAMIYEVDLTPRATTEYVSRCNVLQTSPDSHFTQQLICSRPLGNGRVTLGGGAFILTTDGNREERPLEGLEDERALLREWFGIDIDAERYGGKQ